MDSVMEELILNWLEQNGQGSSDAIANQRKNPNSQKETS
jgi:hypothetical protein